MADEKADLAAKLAAARPADVDFSEGKSELGFVHRRTADEDIYFVANTGTAHHNVTATFRVATMQAELWDPMTGNSTAVTASARPAGGATLALKVDPYESRVIVFPQHGNAAPPVASTAAPTVAPLDLSTNWSVTFKDGAPQVMDQLHSWTDDASTRTYSGVATYEKSFDLPPVFAPPGIAVQLDFGPAQALPEHPAANGMRAWIDPPVREAAVVYVNGQRAGAVWHPPYRLEVTRFLKPRTNQLKIVVANTAINALAGSPLPDDTALKKMYGERFKARDMEHLQPAPSGLTGPISLIASP